MFAIWPDDLRVRVVLVFTTLLRLQALTRRCAVDGQVATCKIRKLGMLKVQELQLSKHRSKSCPRDRARKGGRRGESANRPKLTGVRCCSLCAAPTAVRVPQWLLSFVVVVRCRLPSIAIDCCLHVTLAHRPSVAHSSSLRRRRIAESWLSLVVELSWTTIDKEHPLLALALALPY